MIVGSYINNGYPEAWQHGRLNKLACEKLIAQIELLAPNAKNFYLDTLWLNRQQQFNADQIDNLFLFGLVDADLDSCRPLLDWYDKIRDPSWPSIASVDDVEQLPEHILNEITQVHGINLENYKTPLSSLYSKSKNIIELGYTTAKLGVPIDFAATFVLDAFLTYNNEDLSFNPSDNGYFLCYQLKPHLHRQHLSHLINGSRVVDKGLVTLGTSVKYPYQYPNLVEVKDPYSNSLSGRKGLNDLGKLWTGTHDTCSIGSLEAWQKSFLVITSETTYDGTRVHLSEKVYKPILGMRPFVINGDPKKYEWLEQAGFDTFEDLWPVNLRDSTSYQNHCSKILDVLYYICDKSPKELEDWYHKLYPRLVQNREHFFRYAKQQQDIIDTELAQYLEKFGLVK